MNRRVFVDMDGVVVDFDRYAREMKLTPREIKDRPGAYREMQPIPLALPALEVLDAMGFEVWLATKPPTAIPFAYADKVRWVLAHARWLEQRIILTHDKGLLGTPRDFLIDDRPHRANCERFPGTLIHFGTDPFPGWAQVLDFMRARAAG